MSHKKGFEITCDRCGLKAFAPDDHPSLTIPLPEGWLGVIIDVHTQLCPACAHQWEATKKAFMACETVTICPPPKTYKEEP